MLVHPELWTDTQCNFSLGCVICDSVFFFLLQLWCSSTFHICSPLTPHFPIHFSSYSCCRENRLCVELVKSLSKARYMKWYLFVACAFVLMPWLKLSFHVRKWHKSPILAIFGDVLHPLWITLMSVPLIYFIRGRILRELNTCSWIAYIAPINSDWCMSSLIMYL